MIRLIAAAAALLLAVPAFAADLQVKGNAKWLSDAPAEKIEGTAAGQGALTVDLADLSTIKGKFSFDVASMKSGNDIRDGHLKGSDWLEADKFPTIDFEIGAVKVTKAPGDGEVKEAQVEVTGKFTLHGVTTDLTAPATVKWKGNKVKITTQFIVKLADYKVAGKDGVVGNKVGETIAIDATFKGLAK